MFPSRVMSIPEFQRYSQQLGRVFLAAAQRGLIKSQPGLMVAVHESTLRTKGVAPSTRGRVMPAIATGRYSNSWRVGRPYRSGIKEISMRMFSASEYAGVIEFGRRVGAKMPPSSAIDRWLRAKGIDVGMSPSARRRFIFYVRRAISRRGLQPGRRVLYNQNTQGQMIVCVYKNIVDECNKSLVRKGITP
jgi:hypothetical protein